jgi:hypothetical protein
MCFTIGHSLVGGAQKDPGTRMVARAPGRSAWVYDPASQAADLVMCGVVFAPQVMRRRCPKNCPFASCASGVTFAFGSF